MRIPDGYTRPSLTPVQSPTRPVTGRADDATAVTDESDRVRVSARSRELSLANNGGFDAAKVARIRSSIEAGTFRIDAKQIAERIARGG